MEVQKRQGRNRWFPRTGYLYLKGEIYLFVSRDTMSRFLRGSPQLTFLVSRTSVSRLKTIRVESVTKYDTGTRCHLGKV